MKKSRADTGVKHLPTNCEGYVLGCQDWQELLELSPGSTTPSYNGKSATATSAQHVTKIIEAGFNIKQSSIYIYYPTCVTFLPSIGPGPVTMSLLHVDSQSFVLHALLPCFEL